MDTFVRVHAVTVTTSKGVAVATGSNDIGAIASRQKVTLPGGGTAAMIHRGSNVRRRIGRYFSDMNMFVATLSSIN